MAQRDRVRKWSHSPPLFPFSSVPLPALRPRVRPISTLACPAPRCYIDGGARSPTCVTIGMPATPTRRAFPRLGRDRARVSRSGGAATASGALSGAASSGVAPVERAMAPPLRCGG